MTFNLAELSNWMTLNLAELFNWITFNLADRYTNLAELSTW